MKKLTLLVIVMVFVQICDAQKLSFGVKGGYNTTKINTNSSLENINNYTFKDFTSDLTSGYSVGVFARVGGKRVYLQPEALFSVRNGETSVTLTNNQNQPVSVNQKIKLNSVEIPVLVGVKLLNLKLASLRVFTGPAISILLDNSESSYSNTISTALSPDKLEKNLWDWQLGAGVDVMNFTFDVRYAWGITNITEKSYSFENKGNTLYVSVGFKFM